MPLDPSAFPASDARSPIEEFNRRPMLRKLLQDVGSGSGTFLTVSAFIPDSDAARQLEIWNRHVAELLQDGIPIEQTTEHRVPGFDPEFQVNAEVSSSLRVERRISKNPEVEE